MLRGRGRGGAPDRSAPGQGGEPSGSSRSWSLGSSCPTLKLQPGVRKHSTLPGTAFLKAACLAWLPGPFPCPPGNLLHIPESPVQAPLLCKALPQPGAMQSQHPARASHAPHAQHSPQGRCQRCHCPAAGPSHLPAVASQSPPRPTAGYPAPRSGSPKPL